MKLTIFNVFPSLFAIAEIIHKFSFIVQRQILLKQMTGRMSGRKNVVGGNVQSRKSLSGKFLSGNCQLSGICRGTVRIRDFQFLKEWSKVLLKVISKTYSKQLLKAFYNSSMLSSDLRAPSKKPSSSKAARERQFLKESKVLLKFLKEIFSEQLL